LFPYEKLDDFSPHDIDAEHAVLAVLLLDPGRITEVAAALEPADFADQVNRIIYSISGIPPHVDVHDARDGQKDEILGRALALAREKR
jgi:hypothetical protein